MVTVSADKNPVYDTAPGNATKDKVFLLSIVEAKKYFTSDEARKCIPTAYAVANGVEPSEYTTKDGKGTCGWVLRSFMNVFGADIVSLDGEIDAYCFVTDEDAVRPAMWITIDG